MRHTHVHQHDINSAPAGSQELARQFDGLRPVVRFANDLHVGLGVNNHAKSGAHELLIVNEHHPNRAFYVGVCHRVSSSVKACFFGRGSSNSIWKPPPGRGPIVTIAPRIPARSRIPSSPCPTVSRAAAAPRPSSLITSRTDVASQFRAMVTFGSGPACLRTFVNDS